jgi:flagellar hook-associated protein 2
MATLSGISSTGTLNAPGVGSGLDVQGLVTKLIAVEQQPLTKLATQEAKYQAKLSSLGSISGALSSLQVAAKALASASAVSNSAGASDSSVLTATAGSAAQAGKYSVTVNKLAQPQKLLAAGVASTSSAIGSGSDTTLTFSFGSITGTPDGAGSYPSPTTFAANAAKTPVAVLITSSNNTLAGIRDAINAAGAGVTASIINDGGASPYRLTLTSNDTGLANSLKISSSDDSAVAGTIGALLAYNPASTDGTAGVQKLSQTQVARNADLTIDGVAITSASNTVAEAIQGVTLSLTKEATSQVTVARNTSGISSSLSALVQAYNSVNSTIAGPTAKGALMQGDSAVLGLQRQVVNLLGSVNNSGGAYTRLSDLGVSFQKDGKLLLDSAKLGAALSANAAGVAALTIAIGQAIDTAATGLIGPSGPISTKSSSINESIKAIGSRRTKIQSHLDDVQARYTKQFSALDTVISNMNSTSAYLTQQLANISNMLKN